MTKCNALPRRSLLALPSSDYVMTEKNFLDQAAEYAYKMLGTLGGNLTKLDVRLQTVVVVYMIQGMIDNLSLIHI